MMYREPMVGIDLSELLCWAILPASNSRLRHQTLPFSGHRRIAPLVDVDEESEMFADALGLTQSSCLRGGLRFFPEDRAMKFRISRMAFGGRWGSSVASATMIS
ncbi:hypothetical protein SR39_25060 [Methylobacterium radiotolerans]|nr:hypothetical protein SR39_25060 [Methylobacterium radiotolerans]